MGYLFDSRVILGVGIGFIISAVIFMVIPKKNISKIEVEKKARAMGMIYQSEVKALYNK
ncbi:MAG TPA: flagellar protein [Clostridiaceae bacterium]|nr:flagellar protein [Clostridiaceae bacterium]